MKMPFGQHKDEDVAELPTDYIEWVLANVEIRSRLLQKELEDQLTLRAGRGVIRSGDGYQQRTENE